jgi:hypothetical protein
VSITKEDEEDEEGEEEEGPVRIALRREHVIDELRYSSVSF